jgi:hypothetical protein
VIFLRISSPRVKKNSRRRYSSPRASLFALGEELFTESFCLRREFSTLGEEFFAESPWEGSRESFLLSAKNLFFVVITHKKKKPDLNKCAFHCFFSLMG